MATKPKLTSMTVSLPTAQKEYVKARAADSGCSTPSEYIRRLIHADQVQREQDHLERVILEGLESPSRVLGPEDWRRLRNTLRKTLARGAPRR